MRCLLGAVFLALALYGCGGSKLVSAEALRREEIAKIQQIRDAVAKRLNKRPFAVSVEDVLAAPETAALQLEADQRGNVVDAALRADLIELPPVPDLTKFAPVDWNSDSKVLGFAMPLPGSTDTTKVDTIKNLLKDQPIDLLELEISSVDIKGARVKRHTLFGPVDRKSSELELEAAKKEGLTVRVIKRTSGKLYADSDGRLLAVYDGPPTIFRATPSNSFVYYRATPEYMRAGWEEQKKRVRLYLPAPQPIPIAIRN